MAADAVVHHLQVLAMRMLRIETCQHGDLLVQPANGGLCRALQPRTRSIAYCCDYSWANIMNAAACFKCICETNVFKSELRMSLIKFLFLPFADAVLCGHLFAFSCYHRPSQLDNKDKKKMLFNVGEVQNSYAFGEGFHSWISLWVIKARQHTHIKCLALGRGAENLPRGFKTAAQEHNFPARWTTNYTLMCIWEWIKSGQLPNFSSFSPNYRRFTFHSTSFTLQQVYNTKICYKWNLWKAKIWTGKSFTQLECTDNDCALTLTP